MHLAKNHYRNDAINYGRHRHMSLNFGVQSSLASVFHFAFTEFLCLVHFFLDFAVLVMFTGANIACATQK
jgi:hypothetical protein